MPEPDRVAYEMYKRGLSYEEIAKAENCSLDEAERRVKLGWTRSQGGDVGSVVPGINSKASEPPPGGTPQELRQLSPEDQYKIAEQEEQKAAQQKLEAEEDPRIKEARAAAERGAGPVSTGPLRVTEPVPAGMSDRVAAERETPAAETSTPLPEDVYARDALISAGYDTVEKVKAASDEELDAIEGVGPATVSKLREL